jgi:enoyl-CoA hydratase
LQALEANFRAAESDEQVKAVLIKSNEISFSAGLDLKEVVSIVDKGPKTLTPFVELVGSALSAPLYLSKPCASAVNGHAIAGGYVLAAATDFVALQKPRTAKEYLVGITEVQVGVPFPRVPFEIVRHHLGNGNNRALREFVRGQAMPVSKAFELGFGDVFVEDAEAAAKTWLEEMLKLKPRVFAITKRQMHYEFFRAIQSPDTRLTGLQSLTEQNKQNVQAMMESRDVIAGTLKSKL